MARSAHYGTVSEAIARLRNQGFTRDFNLEENCIVCHPDRFSHQEFEIVDVYYYEGDTDPADEATVYAIQTKSGIKGVLVTGAGMSMDHVTQEILAKLKIRQ